MARYTESSCKLCRREGTKLYLKGARCNSEKCSFNRRPYIPGEHGSPKGFVKSGEHGSPKGFVKRMSDYGVHLREKQKVRRIYGILEKQFRKYFKMAARKSGVTGENLSARQIILHGHVRVNGRKVNIPSFLVKPNDEISIKEKSRNMNLIQEALESATESSQFEWFSVDKDKFTGKLLGIPSRDQIPLDIDERLIVEYYSK
ncbi:MAG: hypothetical protein B6D62_02610 [Candidatus Cloacimonas sp. 4484_275]|nr:MAG: hypothetical protein B6D62_02610 [Candidatus Cloacimonas sp. 4484_275]